MKIRKNQIEYTTFFLRQFYQTICVTNHKQLANHSLTVTAASCFDAEFINFTQLVAASHYPTSWPAITKLWATITKRCGNHSFQLVNGLIKCQLKNPFLSLHWREEGDNFVSWQIYWQQLVPMEKCSPFFSKNRIQISFS